MKFYVVTTAEARLQVLNCDNFLLALVSHRRRVEQGDELARTGIERLARAVRIEASNAIEAREIYQNRRSAGLASGQGC